MISEHSDFNNNQRNEKQISLTDEQQYNKINAINQAIKREIKKVKKPYLLKTDDWYVPTARLYSAKIPRKLYWLEIEKAKSLKLLFARIGAAQVVAATSNVNVLRIAIIASIVLAILLILGLGTLFILNSLPGTQDQVGPQIEADKTGDITIKVFKNENDWQEDCIVRVSNYSLDTIVYNTINERVLVQNNSEDQTPLYVLMYAEILSDEANSYSKVDELYVALENVHSRFSFEKGNKGVLYTPEPVEVGGVFNAFRGLGICLYSDVASNSWGNQVVHIKIHFRAYTSLNILKEAMASLTSAIYAVDKKDIDGQVISTMNPAIRSKLQ